MTELPKMTSDEQVTTWVRGVSLHNYDADMEGGECCPDFSCCKHDLRADLGERLEFQDADPAKRLKMLGVFLSRLLARKGRRVHVIGDKEC